MKTHTLYLDDSGTKEYADDPTEYGRTGRTRYFLFGGLLIADTEAAALAAGIAALKIETFGTHEVEIKSNWLRMPTERRRRYLDKYDISEADLTKFVDAYYKAVVDTGLALVAGVVDKQHMQETYKRPWYAPTVAYEIVLQRAEMEMEGIKCSEG